MKTCKDCGTTKNMRHDRNQCKECYNKDARERWRAKYKNGYIPATKTSMIDEYGKEKGLHRWEHFRAQELRIRREMSAN